MLGEMPSAARVEMNFQQVHLRVNDAATGKPTPVRLRITDAAGIYYAPFGRLTEFATGVNQDVGGNVMIGAKKWAYIDGACEILLPPGELHIEIAKGFEYKPIDETITLIAGKMSLRFTIERWIDMRKLGWYSGDTRVHFLSPDAALLEGRAEDVAVVNLLATQSRPRTFDISQCLAFARWIRAQRLPAQFVADIEGYILDSKGRKNFEPYIIIKAMEFHKQWMDMCLEGTHTYSNLLSFSGQRFSRQADECGVAVNTHNSHLQLGGVALLHSHRVVYPLSFGGPKGTEDWTVTDWCDQCHRKKGLVVWTDPALRNLDGCRGEPLADLILGKIDAFEFGPFELETPKLLPESAMVDYYQMCHAELIVPLVGASDKRSDTTALGSVRTYAFLGPERCLDYSAWIEAVRSGRTAVSNGPLLDWTINGEVPVKDVPMNSQAKKIHVHARARSITPFERLSLIWNGRTVAKARSTGSTIYEATIEQELAVEKSGWLAIRCRGPQAFAHTSAVGIRRENAPGWARPSSIRRLQSELDAMLAWAREKARCTTPRDRERLCHVFEEARTILAKKLSPPSA
jgi:hypothetical protein